MRESPADPTAGAPHPRSTRRVWLVVAALLATGGMVGAMFGARAVARSDAATSHKGVEQTSDQVASTLQLAIQHQEDLVVSLAAFSTSSSRESTAIPRYRSVRTSRSRSFPRATGPTTASRQSAKAGPRMRSFRSDSTSARPGSRPH